MPSSSPKTLSSLGLGILLALPGALEAQGPADLACDDAEFNIELDVPRGSVTGVAGNTTEPRTGRPFFLDYPCDLEPGEAVTFVFNLHGGGSLSNWQRHYFPIYKYKDEYNLIVATPDAGEPGPGTWSPEVDDEYLEAVVDYVYENFAEQEITFWFAGHSFGGFTTRRLICTDPYQARSPVGFVSLSGGRVGSPNPGRDGEIAPLPECDFSHVFTAGEHEASAQSMADTSRWADHLGCGARVRQLDVVDTRPGLIHDGSRQDPGTASWGLLPRPGTTEWWVHPRCDDGRVVADLVRIDKGHTEGLEENVVEQIVQLMMAAGR